MLCDGVPGESGHGATQGVRPSASALRPVPDDLGQAGFESRVAVRRDEPSVCRITVVPVGNT